MLISKVELKPQGALPLRDPLDAYDPELATWQQLFDRRYPHHSRSLDVLGKVESSNEPVYNKVNASDKHDRVFFGLVPNVRCSL